MKAGSLHARLLKLDACHQALGCMLHLGGSSGWAGPLTIFGRYCRVRVCCRVVAGQARACSLFCDRWFGADC